MKRIESTLQRSVGSLLPLMVGMALFIGGGVVPVLAGPADRPAVLDDATIALPVGSKLKIRWVLPPVSAEGRSEKHATEGIRFSIDSRGNPWIGLTSRHIVAPLTNVRLSLSEDFQEIAHLEHGPMMVVAGRYLGYIAPLKPTSFDEAGWPILPFQPITTLPSLACSLYRGAGDVVYLVATDEKTGKSTLYLLDVNDRSAGKPPRLKKCLESPEPITAVTGTAEEAYVAMGNVVVVHRLRENSSAPFSSVAEKITGLAFHPKAGLFYSTKNMIGVFNDHSSTVFFEASNPRIAIHNDSLYVMLPKQLALLALDNLEAEKPAAWK